MADALGTPFMPWQQLVADVCCEVDPETGLFVYRECGLTVPRQSGKTTFILAKSTHRCIAWTRMVVRYAAQTRNDSRMKWEDDYLENLEHTIFFNKFRARKTNGNEAILWQNTRSRFGITSTTEKAGHGGTIDEGYIDEAFAQTDARLEQAFKPAMVTRRNAQFFFVSTAGTEKSLYLLNKVERGRAAVESGETWGLCYFEWSAPDEREDYGNPQLWRETMPALHWPDCPDGCKAHTVYENVIAADYRSMDTNEFRRAYLNQWCPQVTHEPIIDVEVWNSLGTSNAPEGTVAFGVSVDPERRMASIGTAGTDKTQHTVVELVTNRPGTSWLVQRCRDLQDKHETFGFWIDARSAAAAFVGPLEEAGVKVQVINTSEYARACGQWYDDAMNNVLRYRQSGALTAAMMGATKRDVGDAWVFDRRAAGVDVTPLDGCALARYGARLYAPNLSVDMNVW